MARFKFGKKKKEADADTSLDSAFNADEHHSYLGRPSTSSRHHEHVSEISDENASYEVEEVEPNLAVNGKNHPYPVAGTSHLDDETTPWKRHKLFDSPFPRYRHAASSISSEKNEIFIMGGLKEGSVFGDTWKIVPQLSPSGKEIEGLIAQNVEVINDNNPPARVGHASVLCGNAYIVYGGDTVDTDYNGFPDDNFYMFNINNRKYTVPSHILNKPRGRYGHSLGVVSSSSSSSRLYVFGGQLENDVYNDLYYFELTTFKSPKARWELIEPLNNLKPPPLTNHSMSIYKNKIYVFGGVYNNEKVSNDVWCFDTSANKWSQIVTNGESPPPVNEHSSCIISDRMYIYGGNDFSGVIYDSLYCLNLHTFKWTKLANNLCQGGPGPRCGHSMTFLPKLNKILIMGGDKNDYVYSQFSNYETYENFDGQEVGTMVYELDVTIADHFMNGGQSKKLAASAAGGAAAALSRRVPSPSPSEDAFTRHRRSMSAGIDEFRTPNASVEHVNRSLDPKGAASNEIHPDILTGGNTQENFVDVDVSSSSATSVNGNITSNINSLSDRFVESNELTEKNQVASFNRDHRNENNSTPILANIGNVDSYNHNFDTHENNGSRNSNRLADQEFDINEFGLDATASPEPEPEHGARAVTSGTTVPGGIERNQSQSRRGIVSPSKYQSGDEDGTKKMISLLNSELNDLKTSLQAQSEASDKKIRQLENENIHLREEYETRISQQQEEHQRIISEKEVLLSELRSSIDPTDLEINDSDSAGITTSRRGFTELTKYKLNRLDLMNKMLYLQKENTELREKHKRFEPFMNNQVGQMSTLQRIIKGQEERISSLSAQVKNESVLQKEINDWRHKFEDLELEYNNFRMLNTTIEVSDDDETETATDYELNPDGSAIPASSRRKTTRQISSQLESLIRLWSNAETERSTENSVSLHNEEVVAQLQKQVDELMKNSKDQLDGSSTEVKLLEAELQNKLNSLKSYEMNYRDALQSVKNTSRALEISQDEMKSQKFTIEKLLKENNELKMFKMAANVSKKQSLISPESGEINIAEASKSEETAKEEDDVEQFTSAHYNMKVKDLEADLYIMKQERDQLNETVAALKKELYLTKSS